MIGRAMAAAAVTLALWAGGANAAIYSAFNDFSLAGNPNGVWSYGYGTPGSSFTLMPFSYTDPSTPVWYESGAFSTPNVLANISGSVFTGGSVSMPADTLARHPGDDAGLASMVRFTAPIAGVYELSASFSRGDVTTGGDGVGVSIYHDAAILAGRTVIPTVYGSGTSATGSVYLDAGDTLSFVVDRNGGFANDTTILTAEISVPEPASAAILGLGLLGLRLVRRR